MAVDYTLAETVSTRIPSTPRVVRGVPQVGSWCAEASALGDLGRRDLGAIVTDGRTSWVRRVGPAAAPVYLKTYVYQSWGARLRDFGRWTRPFAASRAAREFDALAWMRQRGVPAPQPLLVVETRVFGFLCAATLATAAFPGETALTLLPALSDVRRTALATAIGRAVGRLHALGFFDGNLDLRNLIANDNDGAWTIAKIDSPRHRIVRGAVPERLAARDWARLLPQLRPYALDGIARGAARGA